VGRIGDTLGIRPVDVGATAAVLVAVEISVATGGGKDAHALNALAYLAGAILVIPVLFRRKWPLQTLVACSVLLLLYYIFDRRNISPAPLLCLPLFDAAVAGYLAVAIVIPVFYMSVGLFVVDAIVHGRLLTLASDFLPSAVVLALAIMLGDRLRLAGEERDAEAARRVAEERLRIARELHDTVAHSMATITVQAGSALHLLSGGHDESTPTATGIQAALITIRDTSKGALTDMRVTLGQLRGGGDDVDAGQTRAGGLDRLEALSDAVRAAGAPVSVTVEGERELLPPAIDHAAYRILQESLTNVLRHAGPDTSASVRLSYAPGALTIQVTDDGAAGSGGNGSGADAAAASRAAAASTTTGAAASTAAAASTTAGATASAAAATAPGTGHGLTGMAERAVAVGGQLSARPRPDGGFEVIARLPFAAAGASR
jgi:signal transduction histidine kinase